MCDIKRVGRREALSAIGAAGAALAWGCAESPTAPGAPPTTTTTIPSTTPGACAVTPTETVGPYPSLVDLIRSDIREGKAGTELTLTISVVDTNAACGAVSGALVEIWQCDAVGNYSSYGSQVGRTYLRGIQTTDAAGQVVFTTIYPGWYQGRATHIHAEVTIGGVSRKVTQIAFPEAISNVVHATAAYGSRGSNPTTNLRDGIFADSLNDELVTPEGDPASGYRASFRIGIAL